MYDFYTYSHYKLFIEQELENKGRFHDKIILAFVETPKVGPSPFMS
jgi:hypothetical protein